MPRKNEKLGLTFVEKAFRLIAAHLKKVTPRHDAHCEIQLQQVQQLKPPLTGFFRFLWRSDESMLEVCAKLIADAGTGINGIDAGELIAMYDTC